MEMIAHPTWKIISSPYLFILSFYWKLLTSSYLYWAQLYDSTIIVTIPQILKTNTRRRLDTIW